MATFKSYSAIVVEINKRSEKAVKNACNRLLGKLQEFIMSEFYDAYDNETYARTMQFYESAMTEMLSKSCGKIFMNENYGSYPFSGRGWAWNMAQNIELGNEGIHGGWSTNESRNHKYWDSFENYCNEHAVEILKEELVKAGVPLK